MFSLVIRIGLNVSTASISYTGNCFINETNMPIKLLLSNIFNNITSDNEHITVSFCVCYVI